MRVLIAGAGIAGLTAALSLHAAGIDALVIDQAPRLLPLGAGINLMPHAVRELTELGLGAHLAAAGIETGEFRHFDRHGNRIWGFPCGLAAGYRWPQYSLHRGELQMILLDAVRERLGEAAVLTGTALDSFRQDRDGVTAQVRSPASGAVSELRADVLAGADGLYSRVRAQLHPREPAPRWSGITMWRGLTRAAPFLTGRSVAVAGANASLKFVAYPVSRAAERRGEALVNWVAEARVAEAGVAEAGAPGTPGDGADWNRRGRLEDVLPRFADWTFGWLDVPALIAGAERILEYPMVDRDPLPWWGHGRVTLLGDAAHPMYPVGANGGSQAVLDARVMTYFLATAGSAHDGLRQYERERLGPVNKIVLACRDMPADRLLRLVSERAPDGFAQVTDVLSPAELAAFDDAYRKTTLQDATALNERPSLSVR